MEGNEVSLKISTTVIKKSFLNLTESNRWCCHLYSSMSEVEFSTLQCREIFQFEAYIYSKLFLLLSMKEVFPHCVAKINFVMTHPYLWID